MTWFEKFYLGGAVFMFAAFFFVGFGGLHWGLR